MRDSRHRLPVEVGPPCKHSGGLRKTSSIRYIVIHSAESESNAARGVARYGATTDREVSWHVVVDDNVRIRQLPDSVISWTAPPLNQQGLHVELCGRASYSKLKWYVHQATLKRAAWQVARWCDDYKIPAEWLTDVQLIDEKKGIVTHAQVSRVFKESDHTDPGKNFPARYFMYLVRRRITWL